MEMCVKIRITQTDGTTRLLHVSPERLAGTMFDFDIGMEHSGPTVLRLDDEGSDYSIFLSPDLISRLEFPLLVLKKGIKNQQDDNADADNIAIEPQNTKSARRRHKHQ